MFTFIGNWARLRVQCIITNLPWRMALGKLGIRLMRIGRFLQVRYANWNREFRLVYEPWEGTSNFGNFHVSEPVTNFQELSFHAESAQSSRQTPLVRALFKIQGVAAVTCTPYEIRIRKAAVFSWDELRPDIERVILEHLTKKETA